MLKPGPCVVMLESPPGTGKTYFAENSLAAAVKGRGLSMCRFDGSDDR